jgi:hypothetical protein
MWKCALEQLGDIKIEHDTSMEKLFDSLSDIEEHLKAKGIDIELCHLMNHANFLTEERVAFYRNKILDWGNNLKRELDNE